MNGNKNIRKYNHKNGITGNNSDMHNIKSSCHIQPTITYKSYKMR